MRVGVYGATGFLGGFVAQRAARLGADVTLIGRDGTALTRGAASIAGARSAVAPLDDARALARALGDCDALINCAPAAVCGDRLLRAVLDTRTHYVDAAGEQHHIARAFESFADEASRAGIAVVPACGFDYAIGDCLARLAASGHEPASEILIAYCIEGDDVSGNSAQNAATGAAAPELVFRGGRWRPVPFELDRGGFDFPPPFGYRQMSRYGSGEVVTVPRHTRTDAVRTLITTTSLCPHPALLPVFPALRPAVGLARRTPVARDLLRFAAKMAARRSPAASPAQPARDEAVARARGSSGNRRFVVVAEAHGRDGTRGRAIATGGDYHVITATLLARAGTWLAAGHAGGVFSPATAFDPRALLRALEPDGVVLRTNGGA